MKRNLVCVASLVCLLPAAAITAGAQDNRLVDELIDNIVANERSLIETLRAYTPLLETYLQELAAPEDPDALPARDHYMIGQLDLSAGVNHIGFFESEGFHPIEKKRRLPFLAKKQEGSYFIAEGFAQMVLPDAYHFDRETYRFQYLRREFLGQVRCFVFDVAPRDEAQPGRFVGRIWVEDRGRHIVRFNGTYTQSRAAGLFFHFDSWRVNVAPDLWAPAYIYIEDTDLLGPRGENVRFKGQTRLWGYNRKPLNPLRELTGILIAAESAVEDESKAADTTPLESQREWMRQAEENVIQRLERSGLLAPPSEVDKVLNTVVGNLMAGTEVRLPVRCRVLLTTPLETFSLGESIVISRGLIDVLPDEASLAMVLSDELAHILLGHRTDTMFAFSDQTMFDDPEILEKLRLARRPEEMEAASRKAGELLARSPYKDDLANAGLFLKVLASRGMALTNLIQANLGNQLASGGHLLRLAELAAKAPELQEEKMEQIAALPLGSRIKLDPWSNALTLIETKPVALLSARDKMPFEVTPFSPQLAHLSGQLKAEKPSETAEQR
ncbi:MAG TPA: M48 family metalloprotease [Bryobacterales bacterium]|nr:M48 family metalloprotease [Bryobacterales bacterium]